jgi:hypothetical protein
MLQAGGHALAAGIAQAHVGDDGAVQAVETWRVQLPDPILTVAVHDASQHPVHSATKVRADASQLVCCACSTHMANWPQILICLVMHCNIWLHTGQAYCGLCGV